MRVRSLRSVIEEGKVDDFLKLHVGDPRYADALRASKELGDKFRPAQILWAVQRILDGDLPEQVIEVVRSFDLRYKQKLKSRGKSTDLQAYKTLAALTAAVDEAGRKTRSSEEARAWDESDVVFQNDDLVILLPHTKHASCVHGRGTKWCVSATKTQNHFDEYAEMNQFIYFVMLRGELARHVEPSMRKFAYVLSDHADIEPSDFDGTLSDFRKKVIRDTGLWQIFNAEDAEISRGHVRSLISPGVDELVFQKVMSDWTENVQRENTKFRKLTPGEAQEKVDETRNGAGGSDWALDLVSEKRHMGFVDEETKRIILDNATGTLTTTGDGAPFTFSMVRGEYHNDDGWAIHSVASKRLVWKQHGKMHRTDGPAKIVGPLPPKPGSRRSLDERKLTNEWWIDGVEVPPFTVEQSYEDGLRNLPAAPLKESVRDLRRRILEAEVRRKQEAPADAPFGKFAWPDHREGEFPDEPETPSERKVFDQLRKHFVSKDRKELTKTTCDLLRTILSKRWYSDVIHGPPQEKLYRGLKFRSKEDLADFLDLPVEEVAEEGDVSGWTASFKQPKVWSSSWTSKRKVAENFSAGGDSEKPRRGYGVILTALTSDPENEHRFLAGPGGLYDVDLGDGYHLEKESVGLEPIRVSRIQWRRLS